MCQFILCDFTGSRIRDVCIQGHHRTFIAAHVEWLHGPWIATTERQLMGGHHGQEKAAVG